MYNDYRTFVVYEKSETIVLKNGLLSKNVALPKISLEHVSALYYCSPYKLAV